MQTNVKSAVSLVAVTVFSAIVFGNAIADTPKPVNAFAIESSHAPIVSPVSTRVVGESLDSGLGDLPSTYTAVEFQCSTTVVVGESQDSGLGDLPATYTAAEYQRAAVFYAGAKQDSGLGDLPANYTGAEFQRAILVASATRTSIGQLSR